MARRKQPTLAEKYAAALLALDHCRCKLDPALQATVDREKAKGMSPKQIASHFEVDHYPVPVALDGTNHPTNLLPRPKAEHRHKTAKKDVPAIAKVKRINKTGKMIPAKYEWKQVALPVEIAPEAEEYIKQQELKMKKNLERGLKWPARKTNWPKRKLVSKSSWPTQKSRSK